MNKPIGPEMQDFIDAIDRARHALERVRPDEFRHAPGDPVDPFACRMAAAGYRAIAAELDAVARAHEED